MTRVDRWLLPEGIEEVLPNQALQTERLRRRLLDFFHSWGYDLVIPPLVEFTESLLSGSGSDLNLLTFKLTDQLSGRMMGVRADITPQTARMDAHSLRRQGPNRLCYASTVLYTRPRSPLATRSPIQVGVELYGEASLAADQEVITLLVESLQQSGLEAFHLDLGHVGIFRCLEEILRLDANLRPELFQLLQAKSSDLSGWLEQHVTDPALGVILQELPELAGEPLAVLRRAENLFHDAPAELSLALDELRAVIERLQAQFPKVPLYLDLCELEGYHYHTGIVFAAYAGGIGQALARGGRYDYIGETFGRARPATGFGIDLKVLGTLNGAREPIRPGIYVPAAEDDPEQAGEIRRLRAAGERVVCGFPGQQPKFDELHCDRILVSLDGAFIIEPVGPDSLVSN